MEKFVKFTILLLVIVNSFSHGEEEDFMTKSLKTMKEKFNKVGVNLPEFIDRRIAEGDNATLLDRVCRENMTYTTCGGCERSCGVENMACTMECKAPGCYCKPDYVLDTKGNCILDTDCPKDVPKEEPFVPAEINGDTKTCPPNYTYLECGTCNESCDGPKMCTRECKQPGCYCVIAAAFDSNQNCVPKADCPNGDSDEKVPAMLIENASLGKVNPDTLEAPPPGQECKENEKWNSCGNLCESSCKEQKDACPLVCRPGACTCVDGYVRNDEGLCILKDNCPSQN